MAVKFRCHECGKAYRVSDDRAGARVRCKECGAVVRVPDLQGSSPEPVPVAEELRPARRQRTTSSAKRRSVPAKKKSSSRVLIGGATALVLIIGLLITGVFLLSDNSKESQLVNDGPGDSVESVAESTQQAANDTRPTAEPLEVPAAAVVTVSNQSLRPLSETEGWKDIPEFLQDAQIYAGTERPGRTLQFTVDEGGMVLMAASWDYDGNPSGGWQETRTTKEALLREGWVEIGSMLRDLGGNDHTYLLFGRKVSSGETFELHTRKYNPPFVVALNDAQTRVVLTQTAAAESTPPEPAEDSLAAVVSVNNQSLLPLSEAEGWKDIPEFLQDAEIYAGTERPGRTLQFTVDEGGMVLMAASWDYDGNASGGWYETRATKEALLREGWVETGSMLRDLGGNDHTYVLFGREVSSGESFELHTRKYNPPFVIALNAAQARMVLTQTAAAETTEPVTESEQPMVARAEPSGAHPASSVPPAAQTPPPTAAPATDTKPAAPQPDPPELASKPEPVFDSSVNGLQVVNMTAGKLQEDQLLNYLRDATIFRRPVNETDPASGLLEFRVDTSQTVLLQLRFDRSPLPEVREEFATRKELLRQGWLSAGPCPWEEGDELLLGQITAPFRGRIRTANFRPPWLIAIEPPNIRDAEEEPELPRSASDSLTAKAAVSHLRLEDYEWLDSTADLFRTQLARHHSGQLKLITFYQGLSSVPQKTEEAYVRRIDQLQKWLEMHPDSTAAQVALAGCLRGYAWQARGSRSASGVTEEQFELFHERMTESRHLMTPMAEQRVADPLVYQHLIWCCIGLGLPASTVDEYTEAALKIDPLYVDVLYDAASYYLPRWHGDRDDVVELADRAVRLTRDDLGLGAYASVVDSVRRLHPDTFDDFDFSWDKAEQGFRDLIERFPNDRTLYDRACLAAAAAKDYETVSEMLTVIGDRPTDWIWRSEDYFKRFVRSYSAEALAGEQRLMIRGNVDPITHLDISADGTRVVSTDMRDRIFVHNIQTGALEAMHQARLPFQTFTDLPIPNLVAVGYGGGQLNVCHVDEGRMQPLGEHDARIISLVTSADGSIMVSASRDGMIRIWERGSREPRHTFNVPIKRALQAVAVSNDGTQLAAVCDTGEVHLCDVSSGKIDTSWEVGNYPGLVAFSATGDRLAVRSRVEPGAMSAVRITVWDIETQQEIAHSEALKSIASIAFHPDRQIIAAAVADRESGGAFLWNYATDGAAFVPLVGHKTGVFDCEFLADGQLATCGQDGTVRIWDTD